MIRACMLEVVDADELAAAITALKQAEPTGDGRRSIAVLPG